MDARKLALDGRILELRTGSHLYGTNTPTSDVDFGGIFIAPSRFYLGLKTVEEVDFSVIDKDENGKNTMDAVDRKFYDFRKFIKLAADNNPNIVEFLFAPVSSMVFINDTGKDLLSKSDLFIHKGLYHKFIGYAKSQLHKMKVKPENYDALKVFKELYESEFDSVKDLLIVELKHKKEFEKSVSYKADHCSIGDLNFNLGRKCKDVYSSVSERLDKAGHRTELFLKHGYDTKFGMHCIRLLLEGMELLDTGRIEFPLKDREMLLDIRNGKWDQQQVLDYAEDLTNEVLKSFEKSHLQEKPDMNKIEEFMVESILKNG